MRRELVALVCALACAGCEQGGESQRDAGSDVAELEAMVDTMLPSLARLASLEPREDVRVERRDSAQVRQYVEQRLDQELPAADLAALHSTYALLGLVPDSIDLRSLLLRLYTEQIVGYYDPQERKLYVVEGVPAKSVAPVLAHELVHALQDQHTNLDSLIAGERGNDRQTAAHAALEGHATIVMFAYLAEQAEKRRLDPASLPSPAASLRAGLQAQDEQFPVFREAPAIIRETILFPYIGGAEFVFRLWQHQRPDRPAPLGPWLPQSTEQVLHAQERFLAARDEPTPLTIAPAHGDWRAVGQDDALGELETGIFLARHLGEPARSSANGWDGDVFRLLENQQGDRALLWYSAWDDAGAADRFVRAIERIIPALPDRRITAERLDRGPLPLVRVLVGRTTLPSPSEVPPPCGASC